MCGITGFIDFPKKFSDSELRNIVFKMTNKLRHRGPDKVGSWVDSKLRVALGHSRLSIIDLSDQGNQPMISDNQRYVIVYNGEIYNFKELKTDLEKYGHKFKGKSDTEVILASIEQWGLNKTLKNLVGMFSIALLDTHKRMLYLTRDRLGEKPLYYGSNESQLFFGSELKALREHPSFKFDINREALTLFLRYGYIPTPFSIYNNIFKLRPGTIVSVDMNKPTPNSKSVRYWSIEETIGNALDSLYKGEERHAVSNLDNLLKTVIKGQMISDVPIGAFLSGGIDSSTIVAIMQSLSNKPVKTFTIGFSESGYNEAVHAKEVAACLGTDHTELYVTHQNAINVIPKLPYIYDEPFADSSQIPTFLVSKLAKENVTVSLSGDGGDELFSGYNRHLWGDRIWNKIERYPEVTREIVANLLSSISPELWNNMYGAIEPLVPNKYRQRLFGEKVHKMANILSVDSTESMYHRLVSQWNDPVSVVLDSSEPVRNLNLNINSEISNIKDTAQKMMYIDTKTYLPDDILVKIDRASMGVSLESRVPFLDHRLLEFAWQIPMGMKIRHGKGKWILREVLSTYIPRKLVERPKMGFGVPIDSWLRGPLREWAEDLLNVDRLDAEGYFNSKIIREKWYEHLSGKYNWQHELWCILMFQSWLQTNKFEG